MTLLAVLYDILDKKQKDISASESDAVSEDIEESEAEELTSDSDDASTDVEEPSDESSEDNDYDDDDDMVSEDEDLNEQTQEVLGKKRKKLNKKTLVLENEINNHAVYEGASLMSYQILMNTEKMADTRDIDFVEWQKEHSRREAYFFGPDNVSFVI